MTTIYIYALVDPFTEEVRYVGKTNNLRIRLRDHCNPNLVGNNPHKSRWVAKLKAQGKKPRIVVLEECTSDTWEDAERHWISYHRSIGSALTNVLEGGISSRDFRPRVLSAQRKLREPKYSSSTSTVGIPDIIRTQLDLMVKITGRTQSDIIRAALDAYLPQFFEDGESA